MFTDYRRTYVARQMKILHGDATNYPEIQREINVAVADRDVLYYPLQLSPEDGPCRVVPLLDSVDGELFLQTLRYTAEEYGPLSAVGRLLLGGSDLDTGFYRTRKLGRTLRRRGVVGTARAGLS